MRCADYFEMQVAALYCELSLGRKLADFPLDKFCPLIGITIRELCVWTLQERRLGGLSIIQTFSIFFDRGYNFRRNMTTCGIMDVMIGVRLILLKCYLKKVRRSA